MLRLTSSLCLLALLGCGDGGPLVDDPRVQRWCEDQPCLWQAEGEIERVSSWHDHDYALSFVSDDARLSQFNTMGGTGSPTCFAFTMVAKIDPGVRIFLELDFLDDGAIEFSQSLPETDFDQLHFLITPPAWYSGVRFILRKDGPGRAVLAQMHAEPSSECSAPPISLRARPDGIECVSNGDCANGRCLYGRCGGCLDDASCDGGKICGLEPVRTEHVELCVQPAQDELGDRCLEDAECASGHCAASTLPDCQDGCTPDAGGVCPFPCETTRIYGGTCE